MSKQVDILSDAVARCRGAFGLVALFSFFVNMLMLAGPIYMLQVYDRVLTSGRVETLIVLTALMAVAVLAMAMLETLRTAVTVRIGAWLNGVLSPGYLDGGIRARLAGDPGGSQAFRDLSQVQSFIATQGMTAFFDLPWTPLYIAIIWLLHPWLGMLGAGVALLLIALSLANEATTRGPLQDANAGQLSAQRRAEAAITNAEAVRAMGMIAAMTDLWQRANVKSQDALLRASERGGLITGFAKFSRVFAQSAILGLGAFLVLRGESTPGVMIAASILLGRALAPIDMAMTAWRNFSAARIAYGRLSDRARRYPASERRMALPAPIGDIKVTNLTAMGPSGPVLRRVSFAIAPGEVVAVIGPSAAGKSTLCRYLVGLARPHSGVVRLDGIDIGHWNAEDLGPHVGFLPQEVGLFAGTVRENIARMADAPDQDVISAARLAHAHDMIAALPHGYETRIGDGGIGLSGGQRQRIGLARAVFGRPPLIVLDEPNANLDTAGEAALSAAILDLKSSGSALVIVGHRPSTLAQSDKALLLRDGIVQAFGPRAEVLGKMRDATRRRDGDMPATATDDQNMRTPPVLFKRATAAGPKRAPDQPPETEPQNEQRNRISSRSRPEPV